MSKTIKLVVSDIAILNNELYSFQKETVLSFATKYDLTKLGEKTKEIVKNFSKQNNELLKKYGEEKTEGKEDWQLVKGTEQGDKGFKELEALMEKEETLKGTFAWKDFSKLKSDYPYVQFMKFLDKQK